jgi:hypothetical protein
LPCGGFPFKLWLPRCCFLHEVLDLLRSVDLEHHIEHLLGSCLGAGGLIDLVGLELRQDIAQVVYPLLIEGLEGLEYEGRLGLPRLGGRLEPGRSLIDLLGIGSSSLSAQLF